MLRVPVGSTFVQSLRCSRYEHIVGTAFLSSSSFNYVNPRGHPIKMSAVIQEISMEDTGSVTHEQLLMLFTSGFFGGKVFLLERFVLGSGAWKLFPARFTGFRDDPSATIVMKRRDIPLLNLPPVGSLFFGSFKLLEKHIKITNVNDDPSHSKESSATSYVDFGFGSDKSRFAGCHRFSIRREDRPVHDDSRATTDKRELRTVVRLQSFTCNPQNRKTSDFSILSWFHRLYAKLLFADGIRRILSA